MVCFDPAEADLPLCEDVDDLDSLLQRRKRSINPRLRPSVSSLELQSLKS